MANHASHNREADSPGCLGAFFTWRDRIGAWCGALGLIGVAILLFQGPQEIRDEVPYNQEFGLGCAVFGGLMVLALVLRGSAGYRIRSLLLAMLAAVIGCFLLWWTGNVALDVWALKTTGEIRRVAVVGTAMKQNPKTRKTTRLTKISIDGEVISADLRGNHRRGQTISVLVAPERRHAVVSASVEKDWLPLIDELIGRWIALLLAVVIFFCVCSLPINLWHFLSGPPKGTDPDEGRL